MHSARTAEPDPGLAARTLVDALFAGDRTPSLVFAFISADRDQKATNAALREHLPAGVRLVGASCSKQLDGEGMHDGSILLAGLAGDFEVGLGLGLGLSIDAYEAGAQALAAASAELGTSPEALDTRTHFGVIIDDGLRLKKEELLMGTLARCPLLNLVGGGANSMSHEPDSFGTIHVDGEVHSDAALVALFRTSAQWAVLRSHWYEPVGHKLRVTKVDGSGTRALEIDGQPAAARYAELLGVGVDELEFGLPRGFSASPTGLQIGGEIFLRSPWKALEDGSILFTNLLQEGMELELMRRLDMAGSTREFLTRELRAKVPRPTATLLFHCGGRAWTAEATGESEALSQALASAPNPAGFEVAFEVYRGVAVNTTLTVLALGATD